jgi:serine/threonine protein kinase
MAYVPLGIGQSIQASSRVWYRNIQWLGAGGNAETFLVVATSGQTKGVPFALKIFRNLAKLERRESFLAEVKFLRECSHPSVMRVFDDGVFYDQFPFVVAEYLPNTLEQVMRSDRTPAAEKVSYTLQLLSALDYLATLAKPVIHRDIKPQNIFVKGHSCVLGDFGLMKFADAEDNEDQEVLKESLGAGMPARYRTPDLVRYLNGEAKPTPKSDVFQLGLVVAELFTGRNPQRPARRFTDPVELDAIGPIPGAMSAGIASLIKRMLTMDPDARDPAARFIDPWQGVFLSAIERAHALEGRVF